ncbi:MAG: UDP-N-acetylmuramate dehydrogenase [Arenicellales bacterium WSBS_2016_MAG_OTU3]
MYKHTDQFAGVRGLLKFDEPMSKHSSWRVGGPAKIYFVPAGRDDLLLFLSLLDQHTDVYWVGLGSNLLVRDGGVDGVVIATHKGLSGLWLIDANTIYAEAGVPGAKLARFSIRNGLTGAEFFAGIPGTVGGALAMNAGAFGAETWRVVQSVETVARNGELNTLTPSDFSIGYRSVERIDGGAIDGSFIAAQFSLEQAGDRASGQAEIRSLLEKRAATQPIQSANAGSVFRNPEGDYAARLIETAGLKGFSIGGAQVSDCHANFIINISNASAQDIERLIAHVADTVRKRFNVTLTTEVRTIGHALRTPDQD